MDLGTLSLGAIIALIIRQVFSLLTEERKHRLELKKRYFDKKIDATLKNLNSHDFCLKIIKDSLNLLKESLENNIDQKITDIFDQTQITQLNQFMDKGDHLDRKMLFFYKDDVYELLSEIDDLWRSLQITWGRITTIALLKQNNEELKENIETASKTTRILEEKIKKMFELTRRDFKSYK